LTQDQDISKPPMSSLDLSKVEQLKSQVEESQREKETLSKQLSEIRECIQNSKPSDTLNDREELSMLKSDIKQLYDTKQKLVQENNKYKEIYETMEKNQQVLIQKNEDLEKELETLQQSEVSQDTHHQKIDKLHKNIEQLKEASDQAVNQKEDMIHELNEEIVQLKHSNKLMATELKKMQESYKNIQDKTNAEPRKDIKSARSKKSRGSSTPRNKTKFKSFNKYKRRSKLTESQYHSDTEELLEMPRKHFEKDGKSKSNKLKAQLRKIEKHLSEKEAVIKTITKENSELRLKYNETVDSLSRSKVEIEEKLNTAKTELYDLKVKHEKVLLTTNQN
jgi:DNA repair exonuclease SbcCD ATPase subunit